MRLKWTAILIAAVVLTLGVTANVAVALIPGAQLPAVVNVLASTAAGSAAVLAVVAELHDRLDARMTVLTEFLVARLDELDSHAGNRDAGFVEGYLLGHQRDPTVVPLGSRGGGRRAMLSRDE